MKHHHLLFLFIIAISYKTSAQAEQAFSEGFPSFSFSLGSIHGQNGWQSVDFSGNVIGGCTISDDDLGDFDQPPALKISKDPANAASPSLDFICLSPPLVATPFNLSTGTVSVSFRIHRDNNIFTPGANYAVQVEGIGGISASMLLLNNGTIMVADKINGAVVYVSTNATWSPDVWKQINFAINVPLGTLKYNIMGEDIYQGNLLDGHSWGQFVILHDNKAGSVAYFDSLFVFGSSPVLGANEHVLSQIRVYPNPATQMISISGVEDLAGSVITLTTVDGRIIHSTGKDLGTGSLQIDISRLAAGIYFLNIPWKDSFVTKSIIKQ